MMEMSNKNPTVSVCVVTYNQEKYIQDCLLGVLLQTLDADVEILVGDDASTDKTNEIIQFISEKYPGRIKLFRHEKNLGGCRNYQFLIEQARGDFIAHLDGDDYWLPGKLKRQLAFLENHSECVAVYANAVVINRERALLGIFTDRHPDTQDINYLLRKGNYLAHSSLLYRAHLKNEILSINGKFLDYRIHCTLALRGLLGYLNCVQVVYRSELEGSVQLTNGDFLRQLHWETLAAINKMTEKPEGLLDGIGNFLSRIISISIQSGRLDYASQWIKIICNETSYSVIEIIISFCKAVLRKMGRAIQNKLLRAVKKDVLLVAHGR